jgi:hypothetical protein
MTINRLDRRALCALVPFAAMVVSLMPSSAGAATRSCAYHGPQTRITDFSTTIYATRMSCRTAVRAINRGHFGTDDTFRTRGFRCVSDGHSGGVHWVCRRRQSRGHLTFYTRL